MNGILYPLNFNSMMYLGLGMFSFTLLGWTYFKSNNRRSLYLFLGMVGVGYTIEYVIYVLLNSYVYIPKILARDAYFDSNQGAIASNLLTLPVTAVFISTFRLGWVWITITTLLVTGVEWLFLRWCIYRHNWWNLAYTTLGMPVYYIAAKAWFARLMRPMQGFLHVVTLIFMTWALCTLQYFPMSFLGSRTYNTGWFESVSHDTTAFSSLFWMLMSVFFVLLLKLRWKKWLKYLIGTAALIGIDLVLSITGILSSHVWWDYGYRAAVNIFVLAVADRLGRRLREGP